MELRPGYKQTEVGAIPEDWETHPLGVGVRLLSGQHVLARHCNTDGDGTPYITGPADFPEGVIQHTRFTTEPGTLCRSNDILVTVKGSGAGTVVLSNADYCISRQLMAIRVTEWNTGYIYFSLLRDASLFGAAATGLIPGLSRNDILNKVIPLPPTKAEQQAIAGALRDADALIESLEHLIAKKRHLKQGAVQELLSGKKRLPGFDRHGRQNSELGEMPVDWRVVEIGAIAAVKTGPFGSSLHERDYVGDGTPIITVEHLAERGVLHTNLPMVSDTDRKRLSAYSLEEGDIVFSRVGSVDRNARISKQEHGWLFSGRLLRLRRLDDSTDTNYLSYHFHSEPFKQRVRTVAVGQTMASLNTRILQKVMVLLPGPPEQAAIAAVLFDMGAEIAALEAKLAKARQVKQGMMHNLLTGRIRLV